MGKHFRGQLVDSAASGCDVLIGFSLYGQPLGGEEPRLIGGDRHPASNRDRPTVVTELILMEIGDPFMMRKCLLGIRQRAGQLAAGRHHQAEAMDGRPKAAGRRRG
jgi:hypothetical protein